MVIRIRDYFDVDTIDFTEMELFKEYIAFEKFRIDVRQLVREGRSKKKCRNDEVFKEKP